MGVSVPISNEHYESLKKISDNLGLGLKRTVEFLVSYYLEKEGSESNKEIRTINEVKNLKISSLNVPEPSKRITDDTQFKSDMTIIQSKNQIKSEKSLKQSAELPDRFCSSCGASRKPTAKFCVNCGIMLL